MTGSPNYTRSNTVVSVEKAKGLIKWHRDKNRKKAKKFKQKVIKTNI